MDPTDNSIYDQLGQQWWSNQNFMVLLKRGINPLRIDYFEKHIAPHRDIKSLLDIGCGGGFLTESMSRLGIHCVGIDNSKQSIDVATQHAQASNLPIKYLHTAGEHIPLPDASFDMVSCCDVLEHVSKPGHIIAEAFRLLKPGGTFLYDTINRTFASYISTIFIAQNCPFTSFMPKRTHTWSAFIKPQEIAEMMTEHGINPSHHTGLGPHTSNIKTFRLCIYHKLKLITTSCFCRKLRFKLHQDTSNSYIGHGTKQI